MSIFLRATFWTATVLIPPIHILLITYGGFKNLVRRTASDKLLGVKAFTIAKYTNYDGHQSGLASMIYKFLTKSLQVVLLTIKLC